jgi:hypothetical protein
MTDTPNEDQPVFGAEEPEHCHAGCRLIQPGQNCHPTIGQVIVLAENDRPPENCVQEPRFAVDSQLRFPIGGRRS